MKRRELRDHIFKIVFGMEFNDEGNLNPEQVEMYLDQLEDAKEKDLDYIQTKAKNIAEKVPEIDKLINQASKGWKTTRMNKVDLSILRLAVYEMKWDEDIPEGVAIDEAVELSKKYSSEEGSSFVNGVLAKLADKKS